MALAVFGSTASILSRGLEITTEKLSHYGALANMVNGSMAPVLCLKADIWGCSVLLALIGNVSLTSKGSPTAQGKPSRKFAPYGRAIL